MLQTQKVNKNTSGTPHWQLFNYQSFAAHTEEQCGVLLGASLVPSNFGYVKVYFLVSPLRIEKSNTIKIQPIVSQLSGQQLVLHWNQNFQPGFHMFMVYFVVSNYFDGKKEIF